jgi:hypothetical protein
MEGNSGLVYAVVQVDWFASSQGSLDAVMEASRLAFDVGRQTVVVGADTRLIEHTSVEDRSGFVDEGAGVNAMPYRGIQEWTIGYLEEV